MNLLSVAIKKWFPPPKINLINRTQYHFVLHQKRRRNLESQIVSLTVDNYCHRLVKFYHESISSTPPRLGNDMNTNNNVLNKKSVTTADTSHRIRRGPQIISYPPQPSKTTCKEVILSQTVSLFSGRILYFKYSIMFCLFLQQFL